MNLRGSITDHQIRLSQLYLKLKQRFSENSLFRELWSAMAHDIFQHVSSLNALPRSFWNQLKDSQGSLFKAINSARKNQLADFKDDLSLKGCFERTLQAEEPTILYIYVPLIRRLRENWTDQALDFYITVKAHLARITRTIEAFSGDPLIISRSNSLSSRFEKEVQEPQAQVLPWIMKKQIAASKPAKKKRLKRRQSISKPALPLIKHAKIRPGRPKNNIIEKVALRRRRAR